MESKLPKVYANPINHNLNNVQDKYSSDRDDKKEVSIKEIDDILNSNRHIYRSNVRISIDGTFKEFKIIKRDGNYLLTIDNERIPISKIKSIEVI